QVALDLAGIRVETNIEVGVADLADDATSHRLVIDGRGSGDLSGEDEQVRRAKRLAGHARGGILGEQRIEDSIRNLIGHLIRVSHAHRFARKEIRPHARSTAPAGMMIFHPQIVGPDCKRGVSDPQRLPSGSRLLPPRASGYAAVLTVTFRLNPAPEKEWTSNSSVRSVAPRCNETAPRARTPSDSRRPGSPSSCLMTFVNSSASWTTRAASADNKSLTASRKFQVLGPKTTAAPNAAGSI